VLDAWRDRDALKGQRVRWAAGDGVASGIDDSGALVVETSSGQVTLDAGEVHLLR
jgi:biotin-(acetyl-CoA carboxylase) ligase